MIQMTPHPPYSSNLTPADFFLLLKLERELAGLTLTMDEFKKKWEGVTRTLTKDGFTRAFQR